MDDIVRIPLREGQFAEIDAVDWPLVAGKSWNLTIKPTSLSVSTPIGKGRNLLLHRLLMNPPPDMVVDHIDGNGLNNRRSNLRVVTQSQNLMNRRKSRGTSSRFKGVSWDSGRYVWQAKICIKSRTKMLGRFHDEYAAAEAYNAAAKLFFGENALLNNVDGDDPDQHGVVLVPRHGLTTEPPKPLPVPQDHPTDPNACLIDLGRGYVTVIDRADAENVCQCSWYANVKNKVNVYATGSPDGKRAVGLHLFLTGFPAGMIVDHRNLDALDNRRANLRITPEAKYIRCNRGRVRPGVPYKGIRWDADRRKWAAVVTVNKRPRYLGRYETAVDAAKAYNVAAAEAFGEFAVLNVIP